MYDDSLLDVSNMPNYRWELAYARPATIYPPGEEPPEREMKYLGKIPDTLEDVSDDVLYRRELAHAEPETGIDPNTLPKEVHPDDDEEDENEPGPGKHSSEGK